jgi:hypothetical protein
MKSHDGISPVGSPIEKWNRPAETDREAKRAEEEARSAAIRRKMQGTAVRRFVTEHTILVDKNWDEITTQGAVTIDVSAVWIREGEGEKAVTTGIPWHRVQEIVRRRVVAL